MKVHHFENPKRLSAFVKEIKKPRFFGFERFIQKQSYRNYQKEIFDFKGGFSKLKY
tara:strand:- start:200 stop:367 length:168 start_codon:yes stop_codon:yes gene_type:complete